MEETEGVKNEDRKDGYSPSIVVYDAYLKAVASWAISSKSVT